jgi:hypothetical protein
MLWVPSTTTIEVIDSVPIVVQLCVPNAALAVGISEYRVIVLPTSVQTTSNVGVLSLVILSTFEIPESDADCRSGADTGDTGGVLSSITVLSVLVAAVLELPAGSVTLVAGRLRM